MSLKEVERVAIFQQVIDKKTKQREACQRLGLSASQALPTRRGFQGLFPSVEGE